MDWLKKIVWDIAIVSFISWIKKTVWDITVVSFIVFDDVPDDLRNLFKNNGIHSRKSKLKILTWLILYWVTLVFIVLFTFSYFNSKLTIFTVSANVEKISVHIDQEKKFPVYKLENVIFYQACDESNEKLSGRLFVENDTYIEFLKIQKDDLLITLETDTADSTGYFLTDKNEKILLEDCVSFRVPVREDVSYVYPIEGQILLGGEIKELSDSSPILYNGEISLLDKTQFFGEFYSVGPFNLDMGDIFSVRGENIKSFGFVYMSEENGLKVNFSSEAEKGFIKKYKTEDIEIKNGLWTKIYNDPSLVLVWMFWLGIYAVCRTFIRINLNEINSSS
jgi:hypothetical protein